MQLIGFQIPYFPPPIHPFYSLQALIDLEMSLSANPYIKDIDIILYYDIIIVYTKSSFHHC